MRRVGAALPSIFLVAEAARCCTWANGRGSISMPPCEHGGLLAHWSWGRTWATLPSGPQTSPDNPRPTSQKIWSFASYFRGSHRALPTRCLADTWQCRRVLLYMRHLRMGRTCTRWRRTARMPCLPKHQLSSTAHLASYFSPTRGASRSVTIGMPDKKPKWWFCGAQWSC